MPVIAIVGNKGGVGKTTLSLNLTAGMSKRNSIAVIDADPQGSALHWHAISGDTETITVFRADSHLPGQTTRLLQDYSYIVVDCPPSVDSPQTRSVLAIADLALIPVQPSPMDLWATVNTQQAITQARTSNPSLRALMVINQLELRTTLSQLVRDALTEITLPVANTSLRRRAVYRNSVLEGKSVFDMGRKGTDAATEIDQLIEEVMIV